VRTSDVRAACEEIEVIGEDELDDGWDEIPKA